MPINKQKSYVHINHVHNGHCTLYIVKTPRPSLRLLRCTRADVAVYADVAHIELLAHNQLSPSIHLASQSSFDTHNQAYGLKCNRKSRVPKWITQTNEVMTAKIAESSKF